MRAIIKKMGIVIAGAQDHLKGKIFRIRDDGRSQCTGNIATLAATQHALKNSDSRCRAMALLAAGEVLG